MMPDLGRTLVIGYGNPARGDDGLGPAFIEQLDRGDFEGLDTRVDYQLCVEDAMDMASYAQVIFVDASRSVEPPYAFYPVEEERVPGALDTHSLSPEAVTHLARTLFNATTKAYVLAIRGYSFEPFDEQLTYAATENLVATQKFFRDSGFGYSSGRLVSGPLI